MPSARAKRIMPQSPNEAVCRHFNITLHHGWEGMFTTREHEGAMRNGTRVVKLEADPTDSHEAGAHATILGSFGIPGRLAYFVVWDDWPRIACMVVAEKLAPLDPPAVAMDVH